MEGNKRMKRCPDCSGHGLYWTMAAKEDRPRKQLLATECEKVSVDCEKCGGTGKVAA